MDIPTLDRVIAKCEERAAHLHRSGCSAQARVAEDLAGAFKSMRSNEVRRGTRTEAPPRIPYDGELWNANPACEHNVVSGSGGGVRCTKCGGWFCY